MTTIVCNLQAHAVTHYDFDFAAISANYGAGQRGLCKFGGEADGDKPIDACVRSPVTPHGSTLKKSLSTAYVTTHRGGVQCLQLVVLTPAGQEYVYPVNWQLDGVARATLGRGIRENLLGFGVKNIEGADFEVAQIEVLTVVSKNRRV